MTPQIAAGSIAEAQFLNQVRILQASILQILDRFGIAVELHLEKGSGCGEQLGLSGLSEVLFQTGEAFAKGEALGKLHEADQVAATLTAVTVEQILAGIDIKRRPGIRVQRAESHELLSRGDAATGPVAPLQVLQASFETDDFGESAIRTRVRLPEYFDHVEAVPHRQGL